MSFSVYVAQQSISYRCSSPKLKITLSMTDQITRSRHSHGPFPTDAPLSRRLDPPPLDIILSDFRKSALSCHVTRSESGCRCGHIAISGTQHLHMTGISVTMREKWYPCLLIFVFFFRDFFSLSTSVLSISCIEEHWDHGFSWDSATFGRTRPEYPPR